MQFVSVLLRREDEIILCHQHSMEEPSTRYILLRDRVGRTLERNMLSLGLTTKSTPTQVLRGELLEGLPEAEQPVDLNKAAVVGIERKSLHLECRTEDLTRLADEDANLLLAISSSESRYQTFIDRNRLAFGRQVLPGTAVFVSVKGISKDLPGAVWYKGELPPNIGTWFGVELIVNPGSGTTDGTFRNRRYFQCAPDSGVFVGLDKLTPREDAADLKSQKPTKKSEVTQANFKLRFKDVIPPFWKGKNEEKLSQGFDPVLKIGQRVVTFIGDRPARGTVRYIGDEKVSSGNLQKFVGLELDKRLGEGTGKCNGLQRFVCKRDFAIFVAIETVMPEKYFDEYPKDKQDPFQEQIHQDEMFARSLSCVDTASGGGSVKKLKRTSSMDSAEAKVIMAAGESSKTDTSEFIEKQRQILNELKSNNLSENQDDDVAMEDEDRTGSAGIVDFKDDHFKNTPPNSSVQDARKVITTEPGLSNGYLRMQDVSQDTDQTYADYVNIGNEDHENMISKHKRRGDTKDYVPSTSQSTFPQSSTCREEVMHSEQGVSGNNRITLTAEVVPDNIPSDSEKMEVEMQQNGSSEQLHTQSQTVLHNDDLAANRKTGESSQMAVDNRHGLEVGSMVEVPMAAGLPRYGVIRWIGKLPEVKDKLVAGLELEEEQSACSDGTFHNVRYFTCPGGRGFFVLLENCYPDSRFGTNSPTSDISFHGEKDFGSMPSPEVQGITMPPETLKDEHCGTMRGLQGHHNSCYLDATLYSMFAFSSVFDTLLHRQKKDGDLEEYDKVQTVLKNLIVNPLRIHGFVRADRVLLLRELLDKLSSTAGLVNEEKDPEEFLNSLLQQVLKADPFLHLKPRDVQEKKSEGAFLYQIITDKEENVKIAQVQTLLEQSFISADLILSEVPSCLILQMPRFGNRYKMYDMILPNLDLDVTHIVENVPRECTMCGSDVAQFECKKCYQKRLLADGPGIASYCKRCNEAVHSHRIRQDHKPWPILLPRVQSQYSDQKKTTDKQITLDKQKMELFAVVCIETSHYVAFVKCGARKKDARWCFFDSMADRKGERNGYNIPAVTPCPEALEWLSKDPAEITAAKERGEMPEKVRRLLGDGYLCMYQNLDMTMYK